MLCRVFYNPNKVSQEKINIRGRNMFWLPFSGKTRGNSDYALWPISAKLCPSQVILFWAVFNPEPKRWRLDCTNSLFILLLIKNIQIMHSVSSNTLQDKGSPSPFLIYIHHGVLNTVLSITFLAHAKWCSFISVTICKWILPFYTAKLQIALKVYCLVCENVYDIYIILVILIMIIFFFSKATFETILWHGS